MVVVRAMIWVMIVANIRCHVVRAMATFELDVEDGGKDEQHTKICFNVSFASRRVCDASTHESPLCREAIC